MCLGQDSESRQGKGSNYRLPPVEIDIFPLLAVRSRSVPSAIDRYYTNLKIQQFTLTYFCQSENLNLCKSIDSSRRE